MAGKPHSSDTVFTGKKEVKQSNHDVYTIPPCMAPWADEPLYLVVACWGLQQKRW
ncbi:CaiF/GrlA family transcriptional regulator, partial [Salmonella enterica]|nr:CaiF/GrlA family transcriptional regulator [Salmonella enterica]